MLFNDFLISMFRLNVFAWFVATVTVLGVFEFFCCKMMLKVDVIDGTENLL